MEIKDTRNIRKLQIREPVPDSGIHNLRRGVYTDFNGVVVSMEEYIDCQRQETGYGHNHENK
jgi:hypothetical protein